MASLKQILFVVFLVTLSRSCQAQSQSTELKVDPTSYNTASIGFGAAKREGAQSYYYKFLQSPDGLSFASVILEGIISSCQIQIHRGLPEMITLNSSSVTGPVFWASPCELSRTLNLTCKVRVASDGDLQLLVNDVEAWTSKTSNRGVNSIKLLNNGILDLNSNGTTVWATFTVQTSPICSLALLPPSPSPSPAFKPAASLGAILLMFMLAISL